MNFVMKKLVLILSVSILFFASCSKDGDVNLFSVQDDIKFGKQLDSTILADPNEYPILDKTQYAAAYAYINTMMNNLLTSDLILYRDEFKWQIRIIDKPILNAFAAPGGYLYFYTGFLKYAGSEAELAGVMAHEIAHADRRHSTETLTKVYGFQILLSILMGQNPSQLEQIASQLALGASNLKFSRDHEYEADEYSLRYLNSISNIKNYHPTSIIDFFDRMQADSLSNPTGSFEFLRTHPYDANREAKISTVWHGLGSPVGQKFETEYATFKSTMLPQK